MGLQIIYGKSGTGKSTYIFNEIAKKIENKLQRKIYIITPEQFSYAAEKKLLDCIEQNAVVDAEVVTFNRMAYRAIQETRRANSMHLSSCGKSMLIYDILSDKKNDLKFIGKSSDNIDLINTQITEFKKHDIGVDALKQAVKDTDNKYLSSKINDMLTIYEKYEETIKNSYIDENDNLTILSSELENIEDFKNCDIYIDEFVGFTKQEYNILRMLFRNNNNIYITVCTDNIDIGTNPDIDIFYSNKQTLDKILQIAKQENVKIEEPVYLQNCYRFKSNELSHLEKNIYAFPYKKYQEEVYDIKLFLANNQYSEIEKVAQEIIKLVKKKGYRYNDISVITKNLEQYSSLCKAIFNSYKIPVFIDEKKDLSQNLLVRYILAILQIFAKNWDYESVFEYIKTGFLELDELDINVLENYCLKWGIKANKWYQGEWTFYDESEEVQSKILHMREKVVSPLLNFKEKLTGKKDVKSITEQLYTFLIENGIEEKLKNKITELQEIGEIEKVQEYETSINIVTSVFDELVELFGDKKVSFEKYADILKIGLGKSSLGKIPASQDQVIVGDVDRSRSNKVKAVFIIGLNDGSFPGSYKNEGFFNDNDREKLKELGAELAKGTTENLYDDNFNIYKAFSSAEEKLYLSYSSSDLEGKSLRPSILINRIKKIFPKIYEESDIGEKDIEIFTEETAFELLLNSLRNLKENEKQENYSKEEIWKILYNYYSTNEEWKNRLEYAMKALNYTNNPKDIDEKIISKLYGDTLKTSVSRLEQYRACPFSYYLKYGLNLSEKSNFKIQAIDTGTFMHDVIDSFFDELQNKNISVKQITDEEISDIVDKIIEEKLQLKKNYIFTNVAKYRVLVVRLKKVIKQSMKYIVDSLKNSKFEVLGHELEFKQGKTYEPIKIDLEDGKKVEITGKIDRIDIAKTKDGNYIRIIDYKSSIKDINLNEVVAGLQLQLLTYLDAICKTDDVLPAGVLYFNLIDPIVKSSSHMTDEEIKEELRKTI